MAAAAAAVLETVALKVQAAAAAVVQVERLQAR
jgi:hypothetical protein